MGEGRFFFPSAWTSRRPIICGCLLLFAGVVASVPTLVVAPLSSSMHKDVQSYIQVRPLERLKQFDFWF